MKRTLVAPWAIAAALLAALPAGAAAAPPPSSAPAAASAPVLVDKVVAVVNDTSIFWSELALRRRPFEAKLSKDPAQRRVQHEQLTKEILSQMIDESLVMNECARLHVDVADDEIEKALQQVAEKNKISRKQLDDEVSAQGFTPAEYRAELRRQIFVAKWVHVTIVPTIDKKIASDAAAFGAAIEARQRDAMAELRKRAYVEVRL
jgi:peptidyl-prolyl cis-trans isomerase SurA